jgi:Transmembrane secretion effector
MRLARARPRPSARHDMRLILIAPVWRARHRAHPYRSPNTATSSDAGSSSTTWSASDRPDTLSDESLAGRNMLFHSGRMASLQARVPEVSEPSTMRGALARHAALRMLWIGESASALGTSIATVALPMVAVSMLRVGPTQMGLLEGSVWIPWLIIGLPAGAWVDRLSRRRVMIFSDLAVLVAFCAVPVAYSLGFLSMGLLIVVAAIAGAAAVFFAAAYRAFVPAVTSLHELPRSPDEDATPYPPRSLPAPPRRRTSRQPTSRAGAESPMTSRSRPDSPVTARPAETASHARQDDSQLIGV